MRNNLSHCTKNTDILREISKEKLKRFKAEVSRLEMETEE